MLELAERAWRQGALETAAQLAASVLGRHQPAAPLPSQARALVSLAMVDLLDDWTGRAYRLLTEAASVLDLAEPGPGLARAYADLCVALFVIGDDFAFESTVDAALRHAVLESDTFAEARAVNAAGLAALRASGAGGKSLNETLAGSPRGLTPEQLATTDIAADRFHRAGQIATAAGDDYIRVISEMNLLATQLYRGPATRSLVERMRQQVERYVPLQSPWSHIAAIYELAMAEAEIGDLTAAVATAERALQMANAHALRPYFGSLQLALIALHRQMGNNTEALVWLDRFVESNRRHEIGRSTVRHSRPTSRGHDGFWRPGMRPSELFAVNTDTADRRPIADPLTGLLSRTTFLAWLEALESRTGRLMLVRLKRFAGVNDLLTVAGGDRLLRLVADRLAEIARRQPAPARMGNSEFAVYLIDDTDVNTIARQLEEPYAIDGRTLTTSVAIGVADDEPGLPVEILMAHAHNALRSAVDQVSSVAAYTPAMSAELLRNVEIEQELRAAGDDEFSLVYQPIVDPRTGELLSLEALARWRSVRLGPVPPADFVAVAERFNMTDLLSRHVVRMLLADLPSLPPHVPVAINCSATEFQRGSTLEQLLSDARFGHELNRLVVEVTESAIFRDPDAADSMMEQLSARGVRLYLDDFGTGFANIARLVSSRFAGIKIDRSLVALLEPDVRIRRLVEALVWLAHASDVRVVAEGVESEGQLRHSAGLGCDAVQGFYVAPPMTVAELAMWSADRSQVTNVD